MARPGATKRLGIFQKARERFNPGSRHALLLKKPTAREYAAALREVVGKRFRAARQRFAKNVKKNALVGVISLGIILGGAASFKFGQKIYRDRQAIRALSAEYGRQGVKNADVLAKVKVKFGKGREVSLKTIMDFSGIAALAAGEKEELSSRHFKDVAEILRSDWKLFKKDPEGYRGWVETGMKALDPSVDYELHGLVVEEFERLGEQGRAPIISLLGIRD